MRRMILSTFLWSACTLARSDEPEQIKRLQETVNKQIAEQTEQINQEFLKLQNDLDSTDPQLRSSAIWSICHSQDVRLIPVIRSLLSSPTPSTKKEAILALFRLQAEGVGAEVGRLIADPDPDVRHTAAEYGSHLGYRSTIGEVQRFLQHDDFGSQSIAMHLCRTLPPEEAAPVLGAFLHHSSNHLRKRAVWDLMKYEDKLIRPYAAEILLLAGDADTWVRQAVRREERKLQNLLTPDELRRLSDQKSPEVRAVALRMLGQKGENVSREMLANLQAADPVLRETALNSFMAQGAGPEKEIVALLDDPDRRVKAMALYAVDRLQLKSAVPKLQEIFKAGDRSDRKLAATALLKMDQQLWAPTEAPQVTGALFDAATKVAGGDKASWPTLLDETTGLVETLSKRKDFPCDRGKMIIANDLSRHSVATRGPGDDHTGGRLGGHAISRAHDAVIVTHGNLAVDGYLRRVLLIVTGDLYLHDGYIYDSIVLVHGKIICDGYLNNSIVVAGEKDVLMLCGGYIRGSVAAAGTIDCDGYYLESLLGGQLATDSSGGVDLRESLRFDPTPIYGYLR